MPIVITPLPPASTFTPAQGITWSSDFPGPLPVDSQWNVKLSTDTEGQQVVWQAVFSTQGLRDGSARLMQTVQGVTGAGSAIAVNQAPVSVIVELTDRGIVQDSGLTTRPWDDATGLPSQIALLPTASSSGLTPSQAQELKESRDATWPAHLVDQLAVQSLGVGNSQLPIAANLDTPVFGVIVRLNTIPAGLSPQTPDQLYFTKTLASVLVFRGSDIWLRVPVHTPSKLINLWIEGLALGLADAVLNAGWLLQLSLQVFFLEGVAGEVLLMRTP